MRQIALKKVSPLERRDTRSLGAVTHEYVAAYAQHDYHCEALRRRWDDAEQLQVVDGHPVVFAGAG